MEVVCTNLCPLGLGRDTAGVGGVRLNAVQDRPLLWGSVTPLQGNRSHNLVYVNRKEDDRKKNACPNDRGCV